LHLEHWPCNSFSKGSYTCYRPGQFTSIADNEGTPVANLYFADEHASSFYEWQAFMEGAALPEYRQRNKSFKTSKPASSVEFCVCWLAFSMDAVPSSCSPRSLKRTRSDLDDVAALD
jgi:hypothetical protein